MPASPAIPLPAGLARLDWSVPEGTDAVILELGANDMLRGIDPQVTREALDEILRRLTSAHIAVLLAACARRPIWAPTIVQAFERIYPRLAAKYGTLALSVLPRRRRRQPRAQSARRPAPDASRGRRDRRAHSAEGRGIDRTRARSAPIVRVACSVRSPHAAGCCDRSNRRSGRTFHAPSVHRSGNPADIGQSLAMMRGGLPGRAGSIRENYHLTLRFIGDVDDALAHATSPRCSGAFSARPFDLRLDGLSLVRRAASRALWSPRSPPVAPLLELQAEHERLMQRIGLEPEGRKYTPHVTLARLRDSSSHAGRRLSVGARAITARRRSRFRASCCFRRAPRSAAALMSSRRPIRS